MLREDGSVEEVVIEDEADGETLRGTPANRSKKALRPSDPPRSLLGAASSTGCATKDLVAD
jgi:hypothetical protein